MIVPNHAGILARFDACADSVYQALFSPPKQKSLGTRLCYSAVVCISLYKVGRNTSCNLNLCVVAMTQAHVFMIGQINKQYKIVIKFYAGLHRAIWA